MKGSVRNWISCVTADCNVELIEYGGREEGYAIYKYLDLE